MKKPEKDQDILDQEYMYHALLLAKKAYPAPNPQVGAVLVKNGKIIGEGYHHAAGQPHAEIVALTDAEKKGNFVDGATLYVTLEPCCHLGKTPPCIDALIVAGIKRIVIGCIDKNPLVNGEGVRGLLHAGIPVAVGVLGKECSALYAPFFHVQKTKKPLVTLKAAMTLDGRIAPASMTQAQITGKEAGHRAHELRRDHDGVLVGIGTVLTDDPLLTCRIPCKKQPVPIVLDSHLRIPLDAKVLNHKNVIIATTENVDKKKYAALEKKGVYFIVTKGKQVDVEKVLEKLPALGILSLLVEGGAEVNTTFLQKKLIQRVCFFYAPTLYGGGVPIFSGKKALSSLGLKNVRFSQYGKDFCVEGVLE